MMAAVANIRGRRRFRSTSKPACEMKLAGTMNTLRVAKALWILICAGALVGCTAGSNGSLGLGPDGSFHPDGTAGIAGYTGQGHGGEGWAGDSSGEGGPSAELPAADNLTPR